MSLRDYYLEIPIPGHGAIRVTGTQTNLAALRGYIAGLDRTIETERRDHAKTRALHGTACDQVESFERQLVEAKETIARLNALQRAEADRHRTTPDALDQIEATLRKTYNRPHIEPLASFDGVSALDGATIETYRSIPAQIEAGGWGDDLAHKQGQKS